MPAILFTGPVVTNVVPPSEQLTFIASTAGGAIPSFVIKGDSGLLIKLPFAPLPINRSNDTAWQTLKRSGRGRPPLLLKGSAALTVITFTLTLARPNGDKPVDDLLAILQLAASNDDRYSLAYGAQESGTYRFTRLQTTTTRKDDQSRAIQATAQCEFTEAGPGLNLGPTTGGVGRGHTTPTQTKAGRHYTVKAGDTWQGIAQTFYRNPGRWPQIADANSIRNPKLLHAGLVLTIP